MRIEAWEQVLYDYLQHSESLVFKWGENDCALWASKFVDKITLSDFASQWLGLYDTESGALNLMESRGFVNPESIADAALMQKPIKSALRGDLVLFNGALGICDGRKSYFLTESKGLVALLTLACHKAWAV